MEPKIPLGGGNLPAILVTGTLMFLFYGVGWSISGTIFLFAFLIVGYDSFFRIVILLSWEAYARVMVAEEKDGKQNASDKGNK